MMDRRSLLKALASALGLGFLVREAAPPAVTEVVRPRKSQTGTATIQRMGDDGRWVDYVTVPMVNGSASIDASVMPKGWFRARMVTS
jgi:hypothetical protein